MQPRAIKVFIMHLWTSYVIIGLAAAIASMALRSLYLCSNNSLRLQLYLVIASSILVVAAAARLSPPAG